MANLQSLTAAGRKSDRTSRLMARPAGAAGGSAAGAPREARTTADRLIAEAAKSRDAEAWISRQILAGQKPSQILATLDRLAGRIGGDGAASLTFASVLVFASTFAVLGWALPS
ncbi:hypothetical protein LB519_14880 [Mesorhizobium sp. AD1-1]|uniref:hypothetical protein n=1 Tax=Mesorhizobium sp. AD1-1 TaxID=2876621 RepID=UPI001CCAE00C|nr:hypothetical protein [Mesorhizobium sp. AD1-1]MBZ9719131.1 hypothetical protein [Mesorhizobium sp. AD1-1]